MREHRRTGRREGEDAHHRTLKSKQPRTYRALLRLIHRRLRPRTYVEIGVGTGRSLAAARTGTLCVGIDPAPSVRHAIPEAAKLFELTSDDFFAQHDLREVLLGRAVDFAFIDGMHLFEFALRDFIHLERASGSNSVIAIHDCHPPNPEVATREFKPGFWTGDVWKLIPCLREHRPDLAVDVIDVPPSGLAIVTGLAPASRLLEERYDEICAEYIHQGFRDPNPSRGDPVPASWDLVRELLPAPNRRVGKARRRLVAPARVPPADAPVYALRVGNSASHEITLHGFTEPVLQTVLEPAKSLDVRAGTPELRHFRNLTFFPKFSALYDEHGRRVLETCVRRGPRLDQIPHRPPDEMSLPPRARRLELPVVYCGRLRAHWGHFLTESISRLWALSDARIPDDAPLLFQRAKGRVADFAERFFAYAGVDQGRLLDVDAVTTFADVFVPDPSFALGAGALGCHVGLPEQVAEAVADGDGSGSGEPVYLSRRLIGRPGGGRRIAGEDELEDVLSRRGVRVVSPEKMSYEEQIRLVNRHSTFIGCAGSAFHSLLYALPGRSRRTVVIVPNAPSYYDLTPPYVDFFITDALKGISSRYLFQADDAEEPVAETTLNARAVVGFLEELALI